MFNFTTNTYEMKREILNSKNKNIDSKKFYSIIGLIFICEEVKI